MRTSASCFKYTPRVLTVAALTLACGLPGCGSRDEAAKSTTTSHPSVVYTTFYPTAYFTQRIAGDHVKIVNPCPADADPAFWEPDEKLIAEYQQAGLIVVNGASFEHWLTHANLPTARLVDTTAPLKDELIIIKDAFKHRHGPEGEHTHEGIDGHTWLDPINAKTQAGVIRDALIKTYPAHKDDFTKGYEALAADLDTLDQQLKGISAKLGNRALYCSHPAYNYVGRRYSWTLRTFHLIPDQVPDEATLSEVKTALSAQPSTIMLWEDGPDAPVAAIMTGLGFKNVVYAPCEALAETERAAGEDFLTVMRANIARLERALES